MFRKRKWMAGIYCLLIASLSIGWYPEKGSEKIMETDPQERLAGFYRDENERKTARTVVHYRVELKRDSRRVLERIVEAEAGDQNLKGRQMVANVIINRLQSPQFPDTVEDVVFAHRQFSPVSDGRYYRVKVSELTKRAVKKALLEKDNTKGALYFMYRAGSDAGNVSWFDRELTKLCEYGCHEFFR